MARVTKSNLLSEPWNNVYTLVKNVSNVADPVSSSAEFRKFVYSREPDVKASGFAGYPFVVVNPSIIDFEDLRSANMKSSFVNWAIEIEVVSSDRGMNDAEGQGSKYLDSISDDIVETFNNVTNRHTLKAFGLQFFKPNASGVSVEPLHNELVYRRSFLLTFRSRLQVSA